MYLLEKKRKDQLLILKKINKSKIRYQPVDQLDKMSSINVWAPVSKFILEDKVSEADEAKKRIEEDQRKRIQEEQGSHQAKFFYQPFPSVVTTQSGNAPITSSSSSSTSSSGHTNEGKWIIKENILNSAKLGRLPSKSE